MHCQSNETKTFSRPVSLLCSSEQLFRLTSNRTGYFYYYHMKKYQPSNGTEGDWFIDKFCMNCIHCDPDPRGKKQCDILCRSLTCRVNEPEYPTEWTYNENNEPICTAWVKWDWGNDGNPDDPDNPNYRPPDDPMQLCLPFMLDEVERNVIKLKTFENA